MTSEEQEQRVSAEVLAERARCAAVCREMAARHRGIFRFGRADSEVDAADDRASTAQHCAEAIERGPVTP